MHPAYSIIFFTTASGAGYGLLAWLGSLAAAGFLEATPRVGWIGFGLAFVLIAFGLLSSTFHLGHPERAWRAFSQWRTSWLSREGVMALATFVPALAFAYGWVWEGAIWHGAAIAGAASAAFTVVCTAMIYASLRPVRAWHNAWTVPNYLALAAATGGVLLAAALAAAGEPRGPGLVAAFASLFAAWCLKLGYWRFLDGGKAASTPESATGLGALGTVRLLDPPNTTENFVQREMGYRIARKHAAKLRRVARLGTFAMPFALMLAAALAPGVLGTAAAIVAVPVVALGVVVERWLFFAEAKHVSMLYYGAREA